MRHDRKGRPEGRVVEIVERPPQPIIGRLLHESGVWLVAPEDKRYGQDVLIPKGATGTGQGRARWSWSNSPSRPASMASRWAA